MRPIVYLMGTYPCWSESFIDQELRLLLRSDLPLAPAAVWRSSGPVDLPMPVAWLTDAAADPAVPAPHRGRRLPPAARRLISRVKHRTALARLQQLIRAVGAMHVHAAVGDLPALLAREAATAAGISYSISLHATDVSRAKYGDAPLLTEAAFTVVCNTAAAVMLRQRTPALASRLHVVPHGLVLDQWPSRAPDTWAPTPPLKLLFVGRLTAKKRPDLALATVAALASGRTAATLTIAGDGPLRDTLATTAATCLGVVSRQAVGQLLRDADFLLVPSEDAADGDREGVPNVILEAMASGTPVIAGADAGGIGEVVTDATGWALPTSHWHAVPALICALVQHPRDVHLRLGRARQLVADKYDAERTIRERVRLLGRAADTSG